jgi:phosphoesterase RecJ-like protein
MKDLKELFEYLQTPRRIILIPHVRPDGDAIGSALALKLYFEKKQHTADIISPDDFPDFLNWMHQSEKVFIHQKNPKTCFALLTKADCIFFLDFNSLKRIEQLSEEIKKLRQPYVSVMIDHHREPDFFTDYILWNVQASSTAELIYDFIQQAGDDHLIDQYMAECIYAGIVLDTGIFQYSNTTTKVHEVASKLMQQNINIEEIHNNLYNQYGENRVRFIGYLLSEKLFLIPEFRTAYMTITMADAEKYKLSIGDKEGIVNIPLAMKDIDIAILFTEDKDRIKISFRSKGKTNIELLARNFFQGGGHKNASGGSTRLSLDETIEYLKTVLPKYAEMQLAGAE